MGDRYLAVFTSDKTGPKWREWRALTEAKQAERADRGVAAVHAWNEAHRDVSIFVCDGVRSCRCWGISPLRPEGPSSGR